MSIKIFNCHAVEKITYRSGLINNILILLLSHYAKPTNRTISNYLSTRRRRDGYCLSCLKRNSMQKGSVKSFER